MISSSSSDFNPRPREEGDGGLVQSIKSDFVISIHALVKRATNQYLIDKAIAIISIHALVKRATRFIVYIITHLCISIHALVKRATHNIDLTSCKNDISIHALVKRATCRISSKSDSPSYFNPRPREEGDV